MASAFHRRRAGGRAFPCLDTDRHGRAEGGPSPPPAPASRPGPASARPGHGLRSVAVRDGRPVAPPGPARGWQAGAPMAIGPGGPPPPHMRKTGPGVRPRRHGRMAIMRPESGRASASADGISRQNGTGSLCPLRETITGGGAGEPVAAPAEPGRAARERGRAAREWGKPSEGGPAPPRGGRAVDPPPPARRSSRRRILSDPRPASNRTARARARGASGEASCRPRWAAMQGAAALAATALAGAAPAAGGCGPAGRGARARFRAARRSPSRCRTRDAPRCPSRRGW